MSAADDYRAAASQVCTPAERKLIDAALAETRFYDRPDWRQIVSTPYGCTEWGKHLRLLRDAARAVIAERGSA